MQSEMTKINGVVSIPEDEFCCPDNSQIKECFYRYRFYRYLKVILVDLGNKEISCYKNKIYTEIHLV